MEIEVLGRPATNLAIAAGMTSNGAAGELQGEAALDALLREYLSMVLELRNSLEAAPTSIREDDLCELARALGGTPEAIEVRLMELLGTDQHKAWEVRSTILPSLGAAFVER